MRPHQATSIVKRYCDISVSRLGCMLKNSLALSRNQEWTTFTCTIYIHDLCTIYVYWWSRRVYIGLSGKCSEHRKSIVEARLENRSTFKHLWKSQISGRATIVKAILFYVSESWTITQRMINCKCSSIPRIVNILAGQNT